MLITFDGNETDSFFLLMSLFSQTFITSKFNSTGFFIENFSFIRFIYLNIILEKNFKKFLKI